MKVVWSANRSSSLCGIIKIIATNISHRINAMLIDNYCNSAITSPSDRETTPNNFHQSFMCTLGISVNGIMKEKLLFFSSSTSYFSI